MSDEWGEYPVHILDVRVGDVIRQCPLDPWELVMDVRPLVSEGAFTLEDGMHEATFADGGRGAFWEGGPGVCRAPRIKEHQLT